MTSEKNGLWERLWELVKKKMVYEMWTIMNERMNVWMIMMYDYEWTYERLWIVYEIWLVKKNGLWERLGLVLI